ncbi:hypothetical protein CDO23_09110 [Sinorhizobium meliloti]|nr:hypothetical protein CDO23_09110 [Sinorhizobium meliloti]
MKDKRGFGASGVSVELSGIGVVLAHLIHGDVAGAEPVDDGDMWLPLKRNHVALVKLASAETWMRFMSR